MPVGNRVYLQRKLPKKEIIEAFRPIPAANVCDCMSRIFAMDPAIRLISAPTENMCGAALTVHIRAGDNLFFHKALELARPGDVIVLASGGCQVNSLVGEIIVSNARFKKLAGLVIDAPIRDLDALSQMDFPVYATGATPGGPFRTTPGGEINTPVSCGSLTVAPGDIVLGDRDGVVVIPRADAEAILPLAQAYMEKDQKTLEQALTGTWDRSWIDKALASIGTEIIDGCAE